VTLRGAVQGVGFRPFIYRLATELGLAGWVRNSTQGVCLEVEGGVDTLQGFLRRLTADRPPQAVIHSLESALLDPCGYTAFVIQPSHADDAKTAVMLPDLATCADCRREVFDPGDRRYLYPFTNCTNCGPRFSIIEALPYDRPNTTMRHFAMCRQCQAEYDDPHNRRFHAQPNACPQCGPQLALWDGNGTPLASQHAALLATVEAIRHGAIVAVKGLGGFHLVVDAHNEASVQQLRQRKQRAEKPFALMYPSLTAVQEHCHVSALEARLLLSPASPIVLLHRKASLPHAAIAPGNPYLGVMLPYTPLHHLLLHELGFAVVATSGNRADEPLCTDADDALARLAGIAELFLVHDRPIARHVDDSIGRVILGTEQLLRRARGYAPLPIRVANATLPAVLAVGGHLKNTVALSVGDDIFLSQHLGDLETAPALAAFQAAMQHLPQLYDATPTLVACDAHPDYRSTQNTMALKVPSIRVQHHYAHVLACMADNALEPPVLGVAWDGTGYGLDGTVWGGEFLQITDVGFRRVAHLRPFRLPGGATAIKEPRRAALGLLYAVFGAALFAMSDLAPVQAFSPQALRIVHTMLQRGLNAPLTSSAGRLFDAVASLVGLRQRATFEGQAAMELEFALDGVETDMAYPFRIDEAHATYVIDWAPLVRAIVADWPHQSSVPHIAAAFHNTLVDIIVAVAQRLGEARVVLTGGCFQNRYLTERAVHRLRAAGFRPSWHQRVPPNDGGLALGQVVAAFRTQQLKD
jgi:hydrogenase maturation protein HypF